MGDKGKSARKNSRNRQNKEIMHEYWDETDLQNSSIKSQRNWYENSQYLSPNERAKFDQKFTKPKICFALCAG